MSTGILQRSILCLTVVAMLAAAGCARPPASSTTARTPEPAATAEPTVAPDPTTTAEPTAAPKSEPKPTPESSPGRRPATRQVRLYFAHDEKVGVVGRDVVLTGTGTTAKAKAAVKALLEGPDSSDRRYGFSSEIPRGTKLRGLTIKDKVATVDLSQRFASGGGSLSMQMRAAQVVCTLTRFSDIRSVAFKLDGEIIDELGGEGVMVGPSVNRADFENVLPAILVESPLPGQSVTSPIRLSGSANVFEAQFNAQLKTAKGGVLAEKPVKATSGSGTRGTFSTKVSFNITGSTRGTVSVFDISERDGSIVDRVDIPLRLKP